MSHGTARTDAHLAAARELAGLFARFGEARRVLEHRAPLGTADMRLLWLLTDGKPRTLREIATDLQLEQSTVNRQVNAALAAGLLDRHREGGGAYLVTASAAGTQAFEEILASSLGVYRQALAALGPEADQFRRLLGTYVDAFQEAVDGSHLA